jgi:hypothetical protein
VLFLTARAIDPAAEAVFVLPAELGYLHRDFDRAILAVVALGVRYFGFACRVRGAGYRCHRRGRDGRNWLGLGNYFLTFQFCWCDYFRYCPDCLTFLRPLMLDSTAGTKELGA